MSKATNWTSRKLFLCIATVSALLLVTAAPALAHHKDGHEGGSDKQDEQNFQEADQASSESQQGKGSDGDGDADNDSSTAYTEDNDSNDGGTPNNVEDEGDNQHPSGKDRSVENGGSGTQGKSESHPDDSKGPMRYEGDPGPDKANGPGGEDLADQDGNNGCGNDDDFDDDNNGHCGRKTKTTPPTKEVCPAGTDMAGQEPGPHGCNLPKKDLCPAGTDMAGQEPGPHGCNLPKKDLCPAGTDMAGLPPGATGCNLPKTEVCPADSDMAGLPPGVEGCNIDKRDDEVKPNIEKRCPAGTDKAGQSMDSLADCNEDDVLPKVIRDAAQPLAQVARKAAAILPFTGAGDLMFVAALGLLLIAAGAVSLKLRKS
jgi:hypothetical protein